MMKKLLKEIEKELWIIIMEVNTNDIKIETNR
jgi:hypothetical protein